MINKELEEIVNKIYGFILKVVEHKRKNLVQVISAIRLRFLQGRHPFIFEVESTELAVKFLLPQ